MKEEEEKKWKDKHMLQKRSNSNGKGSSKKGEDGLKGRNKNKGNMNRIEEWLKF